MNKEKVFNLIKKSLKTKSKISINSSSKNIEEWDSLGFLSILTALDKETKGRTSKIKSLADADSVLKILDILKKEKILK
jgi:acyl carrier protein